MIKSRTLFISSELMMSIKGKGWLVNVLKQGFEILTAGRKNNLMSLDLDHVTSDQSHIMKVAVSSVG